jgi:hypothetical protein
VKAFGPIPEDGVRNLAERMVYALSVYRLQQTARFPAPAKQKVQLEKIAKHARQLLSCLVIDDPEAVGLNPTHARANLNPIAQLWLPVELYKIAKERRAATATFTANERMIYLLVLLSDLVAAADRCSVSARNQSVRKASRRRGGKAREGTTAKSSLLNALFEAYAALQHQWPQCAAPTPHRRRRNLSKAFVRAGLALAAPDLAKESQTTDGSITPAFDRWAGTNQSARGD